ncbi:MAG: polyprenyl glycosylphosphotransferase [Pseudonocardiales bacterium]|nr:MAG: polyprenyl glycosylphosphotransferase [Pseudonocardiales bacterium]
MTSPGAAITATGLDEARGSARTRLGRRLPRAVLTRSSAVVLLVPADIAALLLPLLWIPHHWKLVVLVATITMGLYHSGGLYRSRLSLSLLDEAPSLLGRLLVATALSETLQVINARDIGLRPLLIGVCCSAVLVLGCRCAVYNVIRFARRSNLVGHRTLIVGSGPIACELTEVLQRYPSHGLRSVGYLDVDAPDPAAGPGPGVPYLGELTDLHRVIRAVGAQVVIVADGAFSEQELISTLRRPMTRPVAVMVVPRLHEIYPTTGTNDHIGAISVTRMRQPALDGPARLVKRTFDILVSAVLLVLLLPVLIAAAIAVRVESGPGFLFRQTRLGRDGKPFELLKFRSLRPQSDDEAATQWSISDDTRLGSVGRVLRRISIDELPQLWNILRGDMTLVGPRPERPHFVEKFSGEYAHYALRHRVPVGLTGLAQVSGLRGDTPIDDRARFDNYYIDHWSLWLDIKVLLRTVREVFTARTG